MPGDPNVAYCLITPRNTHEKRSPIKVLTGEKRRPLGRVMQTTKQTKTLAASHHSGPGTKTLTIYGDTYKSKNITSRRPHAMT